MIPFFELLEVKIVLTDSEVIIRDARYNYQLVARSVALQHLTREFDLIVEQPRPR
jgi:hypothetical protein